ncbi:MAG: ABC-F family ATP-binding cassette domain-containing protein [Deltaproteobacteria bacterium]|nr:ABC-F family ATP-binding cassette domain-containing protein [Deltaproteobacteria bacterium]
MGTTSMALVALDNVKLAFSGETVLDNVSLQVRKGDRLALIGRNGTGKTSLLEMISGNLKPDSGQVVCPASTRIGYLHQVPDLGDEPTLLDAVVASRGELLALRKEIAQLREKVEGGDSRVATSLGQLQERYEQDGGDDIERRATVALQNVGFDQAQFDQPTNLLSGGERSRLLLARILIMDADLLLLDEPTNHLDLKGIEFLEQYLSSFNGAAIVVSHDRTFIDRFATEIAAIETNGKVVKSLGNYDKYKQAHDSRNESSRKEHEQQQNEIEKQEELIRRTHASKGQKSRQAKSRRKALDKIERVEAPVSDVKTMGLQFPEVEHSGKVVFQVKDLTLQPGGQILLQKVSFNVQRGERIGIIGPNGCGKTTLLNALSLKDEPAQGKIQQGYRTMIGYYDQTLSGLTTGRSVLEELSASRPDLGEQALRNMGGRFLFHGDDVLRKVESFSGGEQSRLALALLVLGRNNVLLLDEPTNHLDIPSREILEEALLVFPGTIITVSHDRYFLDRVAQRIISIEARTLVDELGTFSELRNRNKLMIDTPRQSPEIDPHKLRKREEYEKRKKGQRSEESNQKRIQELEQLVHDQEKQIEELMEQMADPARALDWEGLEKIQEQKRLIEKDHEANLAAWEELMSETKGNQGGS